MWTQGAEHGAVTTADTRAAGMEWLGFAVPLQLTRRNYSSPHTRGSFTDEQYSRMQIKNNAVL